jgi:hypothetical protein
MLFTAVELVFMGRPGWGACFLTLPESRGYKHRIKQLCGTSKISGVPAVVNDVTAQRASRIYPQSNPLSNCDNIVFRCPSSLRLSHKFVRQTSPEPPHPTAAAI